MLVTIDLFCTGESEETPLPFNYIEAWNLELTVAYSV